MYCERKEDCCQKRQEWERRQSWWDRWRDTREVFGREKEMQIEWRSLSTYGGLKPHVSAWGEDTATLHTHARKNAVTCTHQGHRTLVSRIYSSCQFFCCSQKLLMCHLLLFRIAKQINKYTLFLPRSSSLLLGLLIEQYFGKRCHDKKLPEETYAVREVMGRGQWGNRMPRTHRRAQYYGVCLPCCGLFPLQIFFQWTESYVLNLPIPLWKYMFFWRTNWFLD